jgi:hypothetical protein
MDNQTEKIETAKAEKLAEEIKALVEKQRKQLVIAIATLENIVEMRPETQSNEISCFHLAKKSSFMALEKMKEVKI